MTEHESPLDAFDRLMFQREMTGIGTPAHAYPNFADHHIANVIKAVAADPRLEAKKL